MQSQHRWAIEELSQMQKDISLQLRQQMSDSHEGMKDQQQQNMQHMQKLGERLEHHVVQLDTSMEDELNKALRAFGLQLTALSEKFVSDYSPLTDKLRDLVAIAQKSEE